MEKSKIKQTKYAYMFLMPSLIGVMLFVLIPFGDVIRRSFCDAFGKKFVGFDNYVSVLNNQAFKIAAANTTKFIIVCIPLLVAISLLLAVIIESSEGVSLYKNTFLIPMVIPTVSFSLVWKLVFSTNGIFDNAIDAFPIMVFSYIWKNAGYIMILWIAGIREIPISCYEAAMVDGANFFEKFIYITIPSLKSTFTMILVLAFVNSFKSFREAYLVEGAYPSESIYGLQHLFNNWFVGFDVQKMTAGAVMMAVVVAVVIILFQKGNREI